MSQSRHLKFWGSFSIYYRKIIFKLQDRRLGYKKCFRVVKSFKIRVVWLMKVKLDIVSGFLGAGKTTLIKKLVTEGYSDEKSSS